jgi:hypothetical protein
VNSKEEVATSNPETKGYPSVSIYSYDVYGDATHVWQQTESGNIDDLWEPRTPAKSVGRKEIEDDEPDNAQKEFSSMQLKSFDYSYFLLSFLIGVWQWWCVNHGTDNIVTVILFILMGLPFALASYAHVLRHTVAERPNWPRMLFLWVGMPLSLGVAALILLAETGILYAAGFGIDNLPFDSLRFLIGEGAASLMWAICLMMWSREPGLSLSKTRFLGVSTTIFVGVLSAQGLSQLILRNFRKDIYFLLTSVVVTTLSAFMVTLLSGNAKEARRAPSLTSEP